MKEEEGKKPEVADNNCRQHQQRQINLLDHIDAVQDEVSHRMDFIERELDGEMGRRDECDRSVFNSVLFLIFPFCSFPSVLESWMDYTGELEPPEPLSRLPQLKHRMKRLLTQLGKVQQISLYSST